MANVTPGLDPDLVRRWQECLADPTAKGIREVWNDLRLIAYGERDEALVFQQAHRGMLALVWHPGLPLSLANRAMKLDPRAMPETPTWAMHCLVDPQLEYNRRCQPCMAILVMEGDQPVLRYDPARCPEVDPSLPEP